MELAHFPSFTLSHLCTHPSEGMNRTAQNKLETLVYFRKEISRWIGVQICVCVYFSLPVQQEGSVCERECVYQCVCMFLSFTVVWLCASLVCDYESCVHDQIVVYVVPVHQGMRTDVCVRLCVQAYEFYVDRVMRMSVVMNCVSGGRSLCVWRYLCMDVSTCMRVCTNNVFCDYESYVRE